MALLGDIHKFQFLDKKCSRGYAGSLIQQNIGEDIENHGLIKWNVNKKKGVLKIPKTAQYSLKMLGLMQHHHGGIGSVIYIYIL